MCGQGRESLRRTLTTLTLTIVVASCQASLDETEVPGRQDASKTTASERALRRGYDGAPPVIPHQPFESSCTECHNQNGVAVAGVGFSPPSPHEATSGMSAMSRCEQCHVFRQTDRLFAENTFAGLSQDLRRGNRLNAIAPPVIPHPLFMRENCVACHSGQAAREAIRTTHPERVRCNQCHIEQTTTTHFQN